MKILQFVIFIFRYRGVHHWTISDNRSTLQWASLRLKLGSMNIKYDKIHSNDFKEYFSQCTTLMSPCLACTSSPLIESVWTDACMLYRNKTKSSRTKKLSCRKLSSASLVGIFGGVFRFLFWNNETSQQFSGTGNTDKKHQRQTLPDYTQISGSKASRTWRTDERETIETSCRRVVCVGLNVVINGRVAISGSLRDLCFFK